MPRIAQIAEQFDPSTEVGRLSRCELGKISTIAPSAIKAISVTAPVVSRMVKALEELGYITRERLDRDRRSRWIQLTERGSIAVRVAAAATVGNLEAERTAARVVLGSKKLESESYEETSNTIAQAVDAVARVDSSLKKMRIALDDRAAFHPPWLPICDRIPPSIFTSFTTLDDPQLRYGDPALI